MFLSLFFLHSSILVCASISLSVLLFNLRDTSLFYFISRVMKRIRLWKIICFKFIGETNWSFLWILVFNVTCISFIKLKWVQLKIIKKFQNWRKKMEMSKYWFLKFYPMNKQRYNRLKSWRKVFTDTTLEALKYFTYNIIYSKLTDQ